MKAKEDFDNSLKEVKILNKAAENDATNDKIYFKTIILLLCAKLERYVKDSTKEYIDALLNSNLSKENLPEKFIIKVIENEIEKINDVTLEKYIKNERYRERSKVFSLLWDTKYILKDIQKDEFVISISNNGTNAISEVYNKIGFSNIFENFNDFTFSDNGVTTFTVSVLDQINKIIRIRHEIIHEDASPSLSQNDINLFIEISSFFVKQIDSKLTCQLDEFKNM